jgi:hypothetical protein
VAHLEKKRNAYRLWYKYMKEKDNLENPMVNKIDLQKIEWDGTDWIYLAQDKYNGGPL